MVIGFGQKLHAAGTGQFNERIQHIWAPLFKLFKGCTTDGIAYSEFSPVLSDEVEHEFVRRQVTISRDLVKPLPVFLIVEIIVIVPNIEEGILLQAKWLMNLEIK